MPAESHIASTAADLASQVRPRGVDPVAITSATLARISGDGSDLLHRDWGTPANASSPRSERLARTAASARTSSCRT